MSQDTNTLGMKVMYFVWIWLLAITIVEVVLAYFQLNLMIMLVSLLGLSIVKAALIMAYFMHLRFENKNLILTVVPALVLCILLMNVIFPDSLRVRQRGVFRDIPPPVPGEAHHESGGGH